MCEGVAQNPAYRATALPFLFYYIFAGHSTSPTHIFKPTPYMTQPFTTLVRFFRHDLWHVQRHNTTALAYCCCSLLKKLLLAVEFFTTRRVIDMAAALTYSTLLALVPILAVVFGVARGFGYNKYIEVWFRELLGSQPQAADAIINFVNSYLVHTKSGVLLGVGLVLMLYTVLMLTLNVEKTFNTIWQVKHRRSLYRAVTDYLAMLLLVPVVIVLLSSYNAIYGSFCCTAPVYAVGAAVVDDLPLWRAAVLHKPKYGRTVVPTAGGRHIAALPTAAGHYTDEPRVPTVC